MHANDDGRKRLARDTVLSMLPLKLQIAYRHHGRQQLKTICRRAREKMKRAKTWHNTSGRRSHVIGHVLYSKQSISLGTSCATCKTA